MSTDTGYTPTEQRDNLRRYGAPQPTAETKRSIDERRAEAKRQAEAAAASRRATTAATVKARFIGAGGSETEWASEGADILAEARRQAAIRGDDAAQTTNCQRY